MNARLRIINCAEISAPDWTFLQAPLADLPLDWSFFSATPNSALERAILRPNIARLRATWQAARCAAQGSNTVIISHLPKTALWLALFCRILSVRATHIAFAFNFTDLPTGIHRALMRWTFRKVDRFVVFSNAERARYQEYFGIDADLIDFLPWVMDTPRFSEPALVSGKYICAVGGEGRDYNTLVEAVRHAPHIDTIIVTRAYNAPRGSLPRNVVLHTEMCELDFWNVVKHSHAVVVPLRDDQTHCGHITLVGALQLERPIVASESRGIDDYVEHDVNALIVRPGDPAVLCQAIERMWNDLELYERLRQTIIEGRKSERTKMAWTDYFRSHFARILNEADGRDRSS